MEAAYPGIDRIIDGHYVRSFMVDGICYHTRSGVIVGYAICAVFSVFFWTNTNSYELGVEVQKVIDVCEENLPRNEKCTFLIISERDVPESKLIHDEEKE